MYILHLFIYHHHSAYSFNFYELLEQTLNGIDLLYYVNKHIFKSIYSSVDIADFSFADYYSSSKCRYSLAAGLTLRLLMSYIYGAPILDVSRSHTTKQHSRQDSSGRVISSSQRPLPDNTRHSQQTNIHAPGGIRTHDFSR